MRCHSDFRRDGSIRLALLLIGWMLVSSSVVAQPRAAATSDGVSDDVSAILDQVASLRRRGANKEADAIEDRLQTNLQRLRRESQDLLQERDLDETSIKSRLAAARREIESLRVIDPTADVPGLLRQWDAIRHAGLTKAFAAGDEPVVHTVEVKRGVAMPASINNGYDRMRTGFAEVYVTCQSHPVTLALKSSAPMLWKVKLAADVRLKAMVLAGRHDQHVIGLDSALVLRTDDLSSGGRDPIKELTGRESVTELSFDTYPGEPIEVGPDNPTWLVQYLQPEIDKVMAAARDRKQRALRSRFDDVRFEAIYDRTFSDEVQRENMSRGPFTLAGPIGTELRPIQMGAHRQLINDQANSFGLTHQGEFVVLEQLENGKEQKTAVTLSHEFTSPRPKFQSMARDPLRHRILLSMANDRDPRLFLFDLKKSEWSPPIACERSFEGLMYVEEQDVFYGVSESSDGRPARITKLNADGVPLSTQDIELNVALRGCQLAFVNGRVIILRSHHSVGRSRYNRDMLYMVVPESGEIVYRGQVLPHDGTGNTLVHQKTSVDGDGLLAELDRRFFENHRDIVQLKAQGRPALAEDLSNRMQQLEKMLSGSTVVRSDGQVHMIGFYEAGTAHVRVTDRSGPVTLVLCSYDPGNWIVDADEGVQLTEIIVGGYHQQVVSVSPPGVPISIYTYENRQKGFYSYGDRESSHTKALETLKEYTKLPVVTFRGRYRPRYPRSTILVGPEDGNWRAQVVAAGLRQVANDVSLPHVSDIAKSLSGHRFLAMHPGSLPMQPVDREKQYLCEFTIEGPIVGRGQAMPFEAEAIAVNTQQSTVYARHRREFKALSLASKKTREIKFDDRLPRLSWPAGVTFDAKRNRLLVTSIGGGGHLYACDLKTDQWSILRTPGISASAMIYAADRDLVYALNLNRSNNQIDAIHVHSAHGATIDQIELAKPIRAKGSRSDQTIQLAYLGRHLAIVQYESRRSFARRIRRQPKPEADDVLPEGRIYIVDLNDGAIVHANELTPVRVYRDLGERELDAMWAKLADEEIAERQLFDMAEGGDTTVKFLAARFAAEREKLQFDVDALVDRLDAPKFSVRQSAYERLRLVGSWIAPQLIERAERDPSKEVRQRIEVLLKAWKSGEPQCPEEQRLVKAVEVLKLVGSEKARNLLRELQHDEWLVVAVAAKQALSDDH